MSSWSEIRSRTQDPLSSTISSIILRQNQANAITDEITDSQTIFPVRILNSKMSMTDTKMTTGYTKPLSQAFYLPFEPDGNIVKLWTRFDSGGVSCYDYSCFGNNIEIRHDSGTAPQPRLYMSTEDDGVAQNKISSLLNKDRKHYFRITDPKFSLEDGNTHFSFFFKIFPIQITNQTQYGKRAVLLDYIENDQVTHAVRVELDDGGLLYFYVRWDGVDYFVKSDEPVVTLPDLPDYYSEDYDSEDYYASTDEEDQDFIDNLTVTGLSYIFCTFDITNGVISILNPVSDTVVNTWSSNEEDPEDMPFTFPEPFDDPPEPDPPGTPTTLPFSQTQYSQQTGDQFSAVKPVTVSGLTEVYNVVGGDPVTDPVVLRYDVAPGVGSETTGTPETIYNLAPTNSTGELQVGETFYGQRVKSTSSVLYNQTVTEITVYLKGANSPAGTVQIGVIKSNGTFTQYGASFNANTLTSSYVSFTRTNTSTPVTLVVGDAVGVRWTGGSGDDRVHIQRGGSGTHYENSSYSSQAVYDGSWSENSSFSMAGVIKKGGATTTTNPYLQIVNGELVNYAVGEVFPSGSPMVGITPTKIELRVYRHASAAGTITLRHVDSNNTVKATLKTQAVSGLSTTAPTTFNWTWEDLTYSNPIAVNDRILVVLTGGNANPVYVLGNEGATGSNASYDGTRTYVSYRKSGEPGFPPFVPPTAETWVSNTTRDISGKISSGGNDFTGYIHLDGNRKRTGIKADTASSAFIGKKVTKVTATLKKVGTPAAGAIYCRIRNSAGSIRETLNQTDITSINSTDTSIDFVNTTHNITIAVDDTISIEYDLGDASNYIQVRVNKNQFEGVNTILFESLQATINTATAVNDRDLAAIVYTGGETDTTARPRVGLSVNNSNSSLWGKAITKIRLWLKREGSAFDEGETFSVKVIRGSDKATVSTLGTMDIIDLTTTAAPYDFENTGNSYVMKDGDMIVVEENQHGNQTNFIWVKRSATDVIDSTSTCLVEWTGTAYNLDTAKDINAIAWEGGYTIYPDPSIPTPPTPYHYSHEMFFGSATTPDSNAEISPSLLEPDPETHFSFIAADFRLYQGRLIEEEEALNLYHNKYTISALQFGEVNVVAHSVVAPNPE